MATKEQFLQAVKDGYTFKGEAVKVGRVVLNGEVKEASFKPQNFSLGVRSVAPGTLQP